MKRYLFVLFVALIPFALLAQETQPKLEKKPEQAAKKVEPAGDETTKPEMPATSNKGGEVKGLDRAKEAQGFGKGAEKRGFETPKGLEKAEGEKVTKDEKKEAKDAKKEAKREAKDAKKAAKSEARDAKPN
jgi:hypothetical protein